ncbi:putative Zn finger-like uncharacterized protein [Breoghania corrubedonensis]|uniref:Putative Zn finger-like uncharacterized protein n=1 Tax=Breoghania corrubedonensis TaxID=665038 RepID=A0A2T5VHR8_9HYPH|nr:zinc-ribbon domain-containing protein [Breoghania corrubedonensis]PTW63302.1 putative Zn finger-like uncharacterized protein [Breoghania corrubedonensis]
MKIVCPNCSTTYEVGATNIAPGGRDVRCSRCGNTWRIDPETILDDQDEDAESWNSEDQGAVSLDPEADARDDDGDRTESDDDGEQEELDNDPNWAFAGAEEEAEEDLASDTAAEEDDWESAIAANPVLEGERDGEDDEEPIDGAESEIGGEPRARGRRKGPRAEARYRVSPQMRAAMGLVLFAGSIVLSVAMIMLREPVVRAAPNLADLYASVGLDVNLRGLEFRDLRTFREYEKGAPMLIVEGTVENIRNTSAHVPAIRLALRSSDAQEIYAWTVEPRQLWLRAGQTLRFSTRLASPPDIASDVLLRFTDRTKRQTDI